MKSFTLKLKYKVDGRSYTATATENEHFALKLRRKGHCLSAQITPKTPLQITDFTLQTHYVYNSKSRIFATATKAGPTAWNTRRSRKWASFPS